MRRERLVILIVDDDEDLRESLACVLEGDGHEVRTAASGGEALALLAYGPLPALILFDLMMPEMNGWELRARLLANPRLAAVPAVAVTASRNLDHFPIVVDDVLLKPFETEALLALVTRFVGSSPSQP